MADAPEPLTRPPAPGDRLGRYVLEEPLGAGGMASVFRARADDGRVVAIKILHPEAILPEDRLRFCREFETQRRLDHPNVVAVYEAHLDGPAPWIALEYVDGADLATVVDAWAVPRTAHHVAEAERITRALCAGLSHIHARGLIHRDLKPRNVLMTADGRPKLSDFGVVKDPDAVGTALTRAGRLLGTVAFMAPEQITNDAVDLRADLYSLGAILYLLLTGRRPIEASSVAGYLARHLTEVPTPPADLDPDVPPHLSRVCMRLLAKDPAERYPSATAVIEALDRRNDDARPPLRGRDAILTEAARYARMVHSAGVAACLSLVGPPGSGRTATLREIARTAAEIGLKVRLHDGRRGPPTTDWDGTPLLLAIDDADALAPADVRAIDRGLLGRAARDGLPLLLVTTAASQRTALSDLGADSGVLPEVHGLAPLARNDVIGMMRDRGLVGPVAPVLGRRLHRDFAGLPGPIVQQLGALHDAGWLRDDGGRIRAARPIDHFHGRELPVPPEVAERLGRTLDRLDPDARTAAEILATFGRPVGEDLLAHAMGEGAGPATDRLVEAGLVLRGEVDGATRLRFAHPSGGAVTRARMSAETRAARAGEAAEGLAHRRRRADAYELARLREQAGDPVRAYPAYVRAARRAAREARFPDVLRIAARARAIQEAAEVPLSPHERIRYRRWLHLLEGEAQLARGRWSEAIPPLEQAAAAARLEGDPAALARALTSLGRAAYRKGDLRAAEPILTEALAAFAPEDPLRAAACRALADIRLRAGDLSGAEALWSDALAASDGHPSIDAEARAFRGLAHVRALQGRLDASARLLETALDRLERGGDHHVRAGVLARAIELDLAAARLASAFHRSERLVDLVRQHELADRVADAWALRALVLLEIGRPDDAVAAASRAVTCAEILGDAGWSPRLRAARIFLAAGAPDRAPQALPDPERLPADRVEDPAGQVAAVRARLLTATDRAAARDLATWALARPEPLLVLRAFRRTVDASRALAAAGATADARRAAKHALKMLERPGTEGFRLDALLALHTAAPDPRVADACRRLADRIAGRLPPSIATTFRNRWDLDPPSSDIEDGTP